MAKKKSEEIKQENAATNVDPEETKSEQPKSAEPVKKIYRSQYDRVIAGVCGGIADYFNIDLILVRVIFVLAIFFGGSGVIAYLAAWIVIPENPDELPKSLDETEKSKANAGLIGGIALIVFGALLLFDNFNFPFYFNGWRFYHHFDFGMLFSLLFLGLGIYLLMNRDNEKSDLSQVISEKLKSPAGEKKLTRSISDRKLAGVCGGLAEYFNIDVAFVRIGYILLAFATAFFVAIALYIVLIIAIPEEEMSSTD